MLARIHNLKNKRMTIKFYCHQLISMIIIFTFGMCACEEKDTPSFLTAEQTVFMYFPWSSDLTDYFYQNISDMESAIKKNVPQKERILVFMSTTPTKASLFELIYENGKSKRKTLKEYQNPQYTKTEGITSFLNDVRTYAPARRYAMIIGCHGMGWIPVENTKVRTNILQANKKHWEYENVPLTRFFGGKTSEYQTDISTLAKGIVNTGLKMEYILFDDCYMSNVEVAYELKEVTNYLIASTSEVMAYGMPYHQIGEYLIDRVDYEKICEGFYSFYSNYDTPCGTIAVTDCSELDYLASIMKEINDKYTFNINLTSSLQKLDGYSPTIFFDYGDYVSKLCQDQELLNRFNNQLSSTVIVKRNTDYYFSRNKGMGKINTFSGITISDPSNNTDALKKTETKWYTATH